MNSYDRVYFQDTNHSYFDKNGSYQSISHLMEKFIEKFDGEFSSMRSAFRRFDEKIYVKAKKILKKRGILKYWEGQELLDVMTAMVSPDQLAKIKIDAVNFKDQWKEEGEVSSEYGTQTHFDYEAWTSAANTILDPIYKMNFKVIPRPFGKKYDNKFILDQVIKRKENLYLPEALIINPQFRIAGQIDKLFLIWTGAGYIAIVGDYKTDKKIDTDAFFTYKTGYDRLKYPFNYFLDSRHNYYAVKMSFYIFMLERLGIKTVRQYLYHVPKGGTPKFIHLNINLNHINYALANAA